MIVQPGVQSHPELQDRISYSGQLLPLVFLSLVNAMSHHVVLNFRMEIH